MTPTVQAGAGCALLLLSSTVEPAEDGWLEHSRFEVGTTEDGCTSVELELPAGVDLVERSRIVQHLGDGTRRKLDEAFFQRQPRSIRGHASVTVHLPDMLEGDRATVEWTRHWRRAAHFVWAPPVGVNHAELAASARIESQGRIKPGKRGVWVSEAEPGDTATVSAPGFDTPWTNPHANALPPSSEPQIERVLTLVVPPGDPQLSLYPGGGSSLKTRLHLDFEAELRDRSWLVEMGPERSNLRVAVEPSDGAASWIEWPDGVLFTVAASEGPARITVQWEQPDAPTHGEAHPGERLDVSVQDGKIVTDRNGAWFLAGVNQRPIIPARSALVRALDRRFRGMAIPEPAIPNELRGLPPSWATAALIPDALRSRIEVVETAANPLWIRKLVKARKTGGLTPTEAGVMAWLYASQARLTADWALVRPAHTGAGGDASPAGYTRMVVRLEHDGEMRWMDPSCTECAPFELPPELMGSDALGRDIERTPDPEPARWTAVWGTDWVRWELTGAAALDLRRWLAAVPTTQQYDDLAERMAGPGAELVEVEGLDEPGANLVFAARGGTGVRTNPVELPPGLSSVWLPWIGTRELIRPGDDPSAKAVWPNATYTRSASNDGMVTERLVTTARQLTPRERVPVPTDSTETN